MPTFANSDLPPPSSWEEFESIVADLVREEWHDPGSTKYGRSGQAQQGVDIYCKSLNSEEGYCGFQCKNTDDLTISAIKDEIKKADNFQPSLSEYVVMTTAPEDASLQEEVRKLSAERVEKGMFPVRLQMWDNISQSLANHPNLLETHYPQYIKRPEQLASQGFIRLSPKYFDDKQPEEPAICWRVGFNLNEIRRYNIDRQYITDNGDRESAVENVTTLLQEEGNQVIIGPPGSGKSTICRGVACQWYEAQLGTVFYRKGESIDMLSEPSLIADRIRSAAGHVLVVVEDAIGDYTEGIHQIVDQFEVYQRFRSYLRPARVSGTTEVNF